MHIRPGEAALREAHSLIEASPDFLEMTVRRAIEELRLYLLLVSGCAVADHRDGFCRSDRYEEGRRLLPRFYDPGLNVRYFGDLL